MTKTASLKHVRFWIPLLLLLATTALLPGSMKASATEPSPHGLFPGEDFKVGYSPAAIALGHLDDDGLLDAVSANQYDNNVSVLLSEGGGALADQALYSVGARPRSLALDDVNADGALDIVTANHDGDNVSVLLGIGDGTFADQETYLTGSHPSSVALGDLDGVNGPDMVVANEYDYNVSVLLNTGDGTFAPLGTFPVGMFPLALALENVSEKQDNFLDIVTISVGGYKKSLLLGNGDGTFGDPMTFSAGGGRSLALRDLNGDTYVDVASVGDSAVCVDLGNGDGTFVYIGCFPTGGPTHSVALDDVNGDDRLDAVTPSYATKDVSVLLSNGDGTFADPVIYPVGRAAYSVALGDLNDDGAPDIATGSSGPNSVTVLLGNGDGTFASQVTYPVGGPPYAVALGDLDEDGALDAVTANAGTSDSVSVLLGNGDGTFADQIAYSTGGGPRGVALGDLNDDSVLDIVAANGSDCNLSVLLGNGDGTFAEQTTNPAGSAPYSVALDDVNSDNAVDIVTANYGSNDVSVLLGNGDGTFPGHTTFPVGTNPRWVELGDLNRDNALDIVTANVSDDTVSVLLGYGNGWFDDQITFPVGHYPYSLALGDLDGDDALDIVAANSSSQDVSVLLGDGDGTFAFHTTYAVGANPRSVELGDVNSDGHLDMVTANLSDYNVSVLLGNGDGTFTDQATFAVGGYPESAVLGDLNRDYAPDLVSANWLDHNASVLLNQGVTVWHSPRGVTTGPVDAVQFRFPMEMDTGSFSPEDDVVSFTGPEGPLLTTGYDWPDLHALNVTFAPQAMAGCYEMVIGPGILDDLAGLPMDTDGDGVPGEVPDDRYTAAFCIRAARIAGHIPSGIVTEPVESMSFDFDLPMDDTSFSIAADIVAFSGPDGPLTATGHSWVDADTLEVTFDPQSTMGTYEMVIGPEILDSGSNALDQDSDLLVGEAPDDQYAGTFELVDLCYWTGAVTEDTTWDCGVVVVDGLVTVVSGATLTIEAGTIAKLNGAIYMEGSLEVLGTLGEPVVLTSWRDDSAGGDTNGDGGATRPAAGDWEGISLTGPTAVGTLENVQIQYAEKAIHGAAGGATATLRNAVLQDGNYGVYVYTPYVEVEVENCLIIDNAYAGVMVRADSREVFRNCTIVGNGSQVGVWTGAVNLGGANLTLENTIVAFNRNGLHHEGDPPALTVRNSIFFNPAGDEIIWDGDPGMPDLGADGNITEDPRFVDLGAGNYELDDGSPAIDAGRGTGATWTDILGRPPYDDLGMPNKGTGYPAYVDMGAYERQEDTASCDLSVTHVSSPNPESLNVGQQFSVEWTVANEGLADCVWPWQDVISLSSDPYVSTDDVLLETRPHNDTLSPGESYTETLTTTAPGPSGLKYVLVQTNVGGTSPEAVDTNNTAVASRVLAVDVPLLELDIPVSGTLVEGQWDYYRFQGTSGHTVRFSLDAYAASGSTALYVRYFAPPTASEYDAAGASYSQPDQEAKLLEPRDGTYYVGVYTRDLPDGEPAGYDLLAELTDLSILSVSPVSVGNAGQATIEIVGDNFSADDDVHLVAPDDVTEVPAEETYYQDPSHMFATFDLSGAAPGAYDVVIVTAQSEIATLDDALEVTAGGEPAFEAKLILPGIGRPGRVVDVRIEYANTGNVDLPSPLLTIESVEDAAWWLPMTWKSLSLLPLAPPDEWIPGSTVSALALSSDGPAAILRPGQSDSVTVKARVPFRPGNMPFALYTLGAPGGGGLGGQIDWQQLEQDIRPPDTPSDAWDPRFERLKAQVGDTWGDYLVMLRDNAEHLAELGQRVCDHGDLFSFEFVQATMMGSPAYLEVDQDAFSPAPGLPLSFERYFLSSPSYRAREGALGRGWTHSYDITLRERSDGTIVVNGSDGFDRFFEPDGNGGYTASPGDYATLNPGAAGGLLLREKDGLEYHFRADGPLGYIQDANGNRVTAQYDADGRLVEISHSSGDRFALAYDPDGRLASLTDHADRTTTFGYDGPREHLVSVTRPDDAVTSHTYIVGQGLLRDHNLTSISRPGGPTASFQYDGLGRLVEQHIGAHEESTTYSYSTAGKTLVSDALGNTTTTWTDGRGRTARIENPLGAVTDMAHDADSNLIAVIGPTGLASELSYDGLGNLATTRDPMGHVTTFAYGGDYSSLLWARDARGNATTYDYDSAGNLTSITYPDGTVEYHSYGGSGNLIGWTNRRDHTVSYSHNDRGQPTDKLYPDDTTFTYTYDDAGRLISATDTRGATTLEYDLDNDWLTRIAYPDGRYLDFSYDEAGRRTQMVDQDGFAVNYEYDEAGRLARLADAGDVTIVAYTYDEAGRLTREDKGNGTYTTHEYDAAGQTLHLVNHAPGGSVSSRFDYTYDELGRRTGMATVDGTWAYEYDDNGELIHAVLDSINPEIDDQDLSYEYDPVGNRIRTIINGVTAEYTTNDMNQYTQVGTATYEYDADGNMVSKIDGADTWTYAFNDENRLTEVVTPAGTWRHEYDALGSRIATEEDGQRTEYLLDPFGLVNVVGEYDGAGTLVAGYIRGLGLTSRVDTGTGAAYHDFDANGNTSGLTDGSGAVLNTYAYSPFGTVLSKIEVIPNPFEYGGHFGLMHETDGLTFMRARYYDTILGRFVSQDPMGPASIDINLTRYAFNDPINLIDPSGLVVLFDPFMTAALADMSLRETTVLVATIAAAGVAVWLLTCPASYATASEWIHVWIIPRIVHFGVGVFGPHIAAFGAKAFIHFYPWYIHVGGRHGIDVSYTQVLPFMPALLDQIRQWLEWISSWLIGIFTSATPEDKFGPAGYDLPGTPEGSEERHVPLGQTFDYRIEFWNKEDAPVPTQDAVIEDTLDPSDFDFSTFEFTRFGFLKWDVLLPGGQAIDMRVDLRPDMNLAVEVTASFDPETGRIDWWFHCVDPLTGEYPEDPMAGFLPPYSPETGFEIGWVEFSVRPKDDLPSGTQVLNQAFVEFDFAGDLYEHPAPKDGPWVNTVGVDSESDGIPDAVDNCPDTFNPDQDDHDGDGVPGTEPPPGAEWGGNACDTDDDNDGWEDWKEDVIGTDSCDDCPDDFGDDALPPDINMDKTVNILDVALYKPQLGSTNPRYDLYIDGVVNILDVALFKPELQKPWPCV